MRRAWRIFAAGLMAAWALAVSAPAAAADGVDCVVDLLNDGQRAEFYAAYRADRPPSESLQAALRAALQACTDAHGWNDAAQQAARRYSVARLLYDQLIANAPFSTDELARLATAFDTVEDETAQRWMEQGIAEADTGRLSALLAQAGVTVDERNGEFVGEFFAARYAAIRTRAAFAGL